MPSPRTDEIHIPQPPASLAGSQPTSAAGPSECPRSSPACHRHSRHLSPNLASVRLQFPPIPKLFRLTFVSLPSQGEVGDTDNISPFPVDPVRSFAQLRIPQSIANVATLWRSWWIWISGTGTGDDSRFRGTDPSV